MTVASPSCVETDSEHSGDVCDAARVPAPRGCPRCAGNHLDVEHAFCFFQAEDGIRDYRVTGVQTCALPLPIADRTPLHYPAAVLHGVAPAAPGVCART